MSRKGLVGAALIVTALAAAIAVYVGWGAGESAPEYRLARVERGALTATVFATGTLNPVTAVQVGSQVSGQIKEIYVDFNSIVKKNQVIARIDSDSFRLRVTQAMADLEAARATVLTQRANVAALQAEVSRARVGLRDAERELARNRELFEKKFVSEAVLDKSRATYEAAREQVRTAEAQLAAGEAQVRNVEALVKQREAQLAQARVDLERTTIRAPVDGIVVKKSVEPGQTVAASLQAPELFVIAEDLRRMQVETSIDEAEVGRVREGQEATFTVDSFPGRTFRGKVSQVRRAALVVQNVVTYTAVIATSNPNLELFPGMTANVRIVTDRRENVLKVPNAALRFRPPGAPAVREPAGTDDGEPSPRKAAKKGKGASGLERLTRELGLDEGQRARVGAILEETRERLRTLDRTDPAARRKQAAAVRAESRARIAEVLTPAQLERYEAMARGRGSAQRATPARVWVLDADGRPRSVSVQIGLSDGTHTEIVEGPLREGDEVIVGMQTAPPQPLKGGPRF